MAIVKTLCEVEVKVRFMVNVEHPGGLTSKTAAEFEKAATRHVEALIDMSDLAASLALGAKAHVVKVIEKTHDDGKIVREPDTYHHSDGQ